MALWYEATSSAGLLQPMPTNAPIHEGTMGLFMMVQRMHVQEGTHMGHMGHMGLFMVQRMHVQEGTHMATFRLLKSMLSLYQ